MNQKTIQSLSEKVQFLRDEEHFLIERIIRHQKTAQSTRERVVLTTTIEVLFVFIISCNFC